MSGSPITSFRRVNTDSRQTQAGDLFVALPGERFDGHDFVAEVANKGAVAVVVKAPVGEPLLNTGVILSTDPFGKRKLSAFQPASIDGAMVASYPCVHPTDKPGEPCPLMASAVKY